MLEKNAYVGLVLALHNKTNWFLSVIYKNNNDNSFLFFNYDFLKM